MSNPSPYQAAVRYINLGLAVFPIRYKGKTPLTPNGCKDATTDAATVKAWWQRWPNANVGIATGMKSGGLVVIDLDIDEVKGVDGYHTLEDWERENGSLPDSWRSITGRGGYHIFYRGMRPIGNRAGLLEGVDVRGEGGYIVAPPSVHSNGCRYEWEFDPDEFELAVADSTVMKLIEYREVRSTEFVVPESITAGCRNETMFKYACSLQSKGLTDEAIIAAMRVENEKRCVPPLEEKELLKTLDSVFRRYNKGAVIPKQPTAYEPEDEAYIDLDYTEKGKIKQTIDNMCRVLRGDPELAGKIKYNVLSYSPFICGSLPWCNEDNYREWNNTDDSNLKCYLEAKYGFRSLDKIMEALNIVINENRFNPVVEYLEQFAWDGKPHIENLLPDYLGAKKERYTTECLKLFMLGAISRAYKPGCKFDYMLTLTGGQGLGKSTFFRIMAGNDEWFCDNFNTMDGDKATEKLRGMWIVELAELLAVKKAQAVESIKAFITSTVDTYRPPYGRRTEQRPRVCVFAGTTNSDHFLTDKTGNRRYLPVKVSKEGVKKSLFDNPEAVRYEFQQAWAEALHMFKELGYDKPGVLPKLVLPADLEEVVLNKQNEYVEEDVRVGIIQEWLDNTQENYVCVAMIYELALKNDYDKPDRRISNELHDIMLHSIRGWQRVQNDHGGRKKLRKYGVQISYERISAGNGFVERGGDTPFDA